MDDCVHFGGEIGNRNGLPIYRCYAGQACVEFAADVDKHHGAKVVACEGCPQFVKRNSGAEYVSCVNRGEPTGETITCGCSIDRNVYHCSAHGRCLKRLPPGNLDKWKSQLEGVTVCRDCDDATDGTDTWGPGTKILWVMNDFAQGGLSRYTHDLMMILKPLPISVRVIYVSDFRLDRNLRNSLCVPIERFSLGKYLKLVKEADIVTTVGISRFTQDQELILSIAAGKLLGQAHGVCSFTQESVRDQAHHTDRFVCCSDGVEELIPNGCYSHVPPMPIDFDRCRRQKSRGSARLAMGIDEHAIVVATACRTAPEKGLVRLAKEVAQIPGNVVLLYAGSGHAEAEILPQMRAILGDRLRHLPWAKLPSDYLDPADVFVCMSEAEGGPLTVLEAMVHQTPVVSTKVGILPSLRGLWDLYRDPSTILEAARKSKFKLKMIADVIELEKIPHDYVRNDWARIFSLMLRSQISF